MLIQGSVSQTSDFCLFQHQITSNFYPTVSSELNASFNKPNKTRLPSLNPKESEISQLDGEVVYNIRKMLVSTQRRELLWFETITKHTLGWEIDDRNLKIMNLTYFRPKMRGMSKTKKKQPSQHQDLLTKHQTSEIPYLLEYNAQNFIPKTPTRFYTKNINSNTNSLYSNKYGIWKHHIWCHFVCRTLQGYF